MCDGYSWVMAAAAVVTAVSGYQEAQVQKRAGENDAAIAENNARLADDQAQDAAIQGSRESQQAAWRSRALLGAQRAAVAANGLDSELGTPFDLGSEASVFGAADQSAIGVDAARKAWGFGAEALNYRNQGATAKWLGKAQSKVTLLRTLGNTVSTAAAGYSGGGGQYTGNVNSSIYGTAPSSGGGSFVNGYGRY